MNLLILFFGFLTCLAGIVILINPQLIFGILEKYSGRIELYILAILIRLLLGILLIIQAGVSKFPLVIEVIGWLAIIAALTFALMGRNRFIRFIEWALSLVDKLGRVGGIIAFSFGAFIIYAFV